MLPGQDHPWLQPSLPSGVPAEVGTGFSGHVVVLWPQLCPLSQPCSQLESHTGTVHHAICSEKCVHAPGQNRHGSRVVQKSQPVILELRWAGQC